MREALPYSEPTTSRDAAMRMSRKPEKVKRDRGLILDFLRTQGASTDREMQDMIPMDPNSQRPRRGELARRGDIYKTGERRNGCAVWDLVPGLGDAA